jgi:hypothetical protein
MPELRGWVLGAVLTLRSLTAAAEGDCQQFSWDVARERALFATQAVALAAGNDSATAPALGIDHLYQLQLKPLALIHFVTAPGRHGGGAGDTEGFGGLAALRIPAPGIYRISLDAPAWVDVVADGGLVSVKDFQGAHDCTAPRKILEYEFQVSRQVTVQVSGASTSGVRLVVTRLGT